MVGGIESQVVFVYASELRLSPLPPMCNFPGNMLCIPAANLAGKPKTEESSRNEGCHNGKETIPAVCYAELYGDLTSYNVPQLTLGH